MGLGDVLTDFATGYKEEPKSSLQGFLSKFNASSGLYANTIDPLNTFDIKFSFYPKITPKKKKKKKGFGAKLGDVVKSAGVRAIDNITGGLAGQFARYNKNVFNEARKTYNESDNNTQMTFIEYLARGNMFMSDETSFSGVSKNMTSPQLIMDLSYYVQNMNLPQIIQKDGGQIETMVGNFPVNGRCVIPSSQEFQMEVINTKQPLLEKIFYPWMREVTLPVWTYDDQPYSTADVTVSFKKHADVKYMFLNCRPKNIATYTPTNDLGSMTRSVSFAFDYMFVLSDNKTADDLKDTGIQILTGVHNGIGTTLGL